MKPKLRFLIPPYDVQDKSAPTPLQLLIEELRSGRWSTFQAAVAFGRTTGNYLALLDAMESFLEAGGEIYLTFSADQFSEYSFASDVEAVELLLERFDTFDNFDLNLYREQGRSFHPKLYLFSNEAENVAGLMIGSSNWTGGGLTNNVEANVVIQLNLEKEEEKEAYKRIRTYFDVFWTDSNE